MKTYILFLFSFLFSVLLSAQQQKVQSFYVGAYTSEGAEGISLCSFNTKTGEIILEKTTTGIDNPSFLRLSPNKKYLYAVSETNNDSGKTGSLVVAYKVKKDGSLKLINRQSSNGNGPCHVDVSQDGKYVAIATYGGGTTSLYPVKKDGSLKKATSVITNTDSSLNEGRQSKPHAHSIKFSPYDNQVFGADLGTDQLNIYHLRNNELRSEDQNYVKMTPDAGPRHFDFHPSGKIIYVINELNSTIETVQQENKSWNTIQKISTLPDDFEGKSFCADIHISKDGRFLYGSNRGHNSIAVYSVNKSDQTLENLGVVSVEGDWPRNFGLTPDGKWMLVANQKSNDITVFEINQETGMPKFSGNKFELPSPVCIEFL